MFQGNDASEESRQIGCSNIQVLDIEQFSFHVVVVYKTYYTVMRLEYADGTFSAKVRFNQAISTTHGDFLQVGIRSFIIYDEVRHKITYKNRLVTLEPTKLECYDLTFESVSSVWSRDLMRDDYTLSLNGMIFLTYPSKDSVKLT